MRKQFPIGSGLNVQRRVDGNVVLGTQNDAFGESASAPPPLPQTRFDPSQVPGDIVDERITAIENEIGALQVHTYITMFDDSPLIIL